MKILLMQSYYGKHSNPPFPLGLSYIAHSLNHHEVIGFDPNVEEDYLKKMEGLIRQFRPDVVGISLRNIWPFYESLYEGLFYKEALIPILGVIRSCGVQTIIMGGPGFSIYAKEIMEDLSDIDYGVFREGEETFPQLLENLDHPEKVKGVFCRREGKIFFTGERELGQFEAPPYPRWDVFDMNKYRNFSGSFGVQTKRGCALRCLYCVYPHLCGNRLFLRSPQKVVNEIEYLLEVYGVRDIVFVDTVFNVPTEHAKEIAHELIKRKLGIKWTAWFHPKHMTENFTKLMVESGCYLFEFSPDTYSNKTLRLLQKDLSKEEIFKTYQLIRKTDGANVIYNFFINVPGETLFTFFELLSFYFRVILFLRSKLKRIVLSHIHIEPDTELYRLCLEKEIINKETRFLGSKENFEKLFYRNSLWVETVFRSLSITKKFFKFLFKRGVQEGAI